MQVHLEIELHVGPERIAGETRARQVQRSCPVTDAFLNGWIVSSRSEILRRPVVLAGIVRL